MYIEDQYIQDQFNQNFIEGVPGNIVIYGTGQHTKELLDNIKSDRIVGLMDATQTGQIIYGKRVLSFEEVAVIPDVYIVILARKSVITVIYRRIQEFVTAHNISVFDINGNVLKADTINNQAKECFGLKEETLRTMINEAKVISFDIFDTLMCRRALRPTDVFSMVDKAIGEADYVFSKERIKAESELPKESNYDIDDIYCQFQANTNESDDVIAALKELEIQMEEKVLRRREVMCDLLQEAHKLGKKVYLISDMYLPEAVIAKILEDKRIVQYDELYVSTDYKSSKTEHLFEIVRDENNINTSEWLHIGDNTYSDIYAPGKLGIKTFKLYSTIEMFEESIYSKLLDGTPTLEENVIISYFAAEAFNSPFGNFYENGKLIVKDYKLLSKLIVAPLLMKYIVWLAQLLKENDNDFVLFPSRDGFVLEQIYKALCNKYPQLDLPQSVYFYTSRRAVLVAAAEDIPDIEYIIKLPDPGSVSARISKRFDIAPDTEYELDNIPDFLWSELLEISNREGVWYKNYLERIGYFSHKKVAIVDFVAVGTVQEAIERLTDSKMQGYYFMRRTPNNKYAGRIQCESMYPVAGDFQGESKVYRFYYFLENIVSSYEPSLERINADGECDFYKEPRTKDAIEQLQGFHEAIMDYCTDLFELYPNVTGMDADIKVYDELLGFFDRDYMDIDESILGKVINYDELLGKVVTELNR